MTKEKAQQRMYEITLEREHLEEKCARVRRYILELCAETGELLTEHPTLHFRRPSTGTK